MGDKTFLLSAGGTGGHLFPAQALASELQDRGHNVHLITDHRAEKYAGYFPCDDMHIVRSATIGSKNPIALLKAGWSLFKGLRQSGRVIRKIKPSLVIGFGGYPTVPPLLAASQAARPTIIHEQNAVMGRANKMLAGKVTAIAGGFLSADHQTFGNKIYVTGNPVRPQVLKAAETSYQTPSPDGAFRLVVFGGSQGAQFFGRTLPDALQYLSDSDRARLRLTLQARPEDVDFARERCEALGIKAEISPFFDDMADRIAQSHLVMSRSGASTVSELAVIGCPAILVPYPFALDHDQAANAQNMVDQGGAEVIAQNMLNAETLGQLIARNMSDISGLKDRADNAKRSGKPDATQLLANMVEAVAQGQSISQFKATLESKEQEL